VLKYLISSTNFEILSNPSILASFLKKKEVNKEKSKPSKLKEKFFSKKK
jgi:hypothetical protein